MESQSKIVLVTGANRGIGFEVAREFAQSGWTAIIGARDAQKGHEAESRLRDEGLEAVFVSLDTTNSDSIQKAAKEVSHKFGRLDALINNAGVFMDWGVLAADTPMHILRQTFDTNFFGVWETTQAFLPLLEKSESGRIVNVSSSSGSLTYLTDPDSIYYSMAVPVYQASKTGLNAITVQFARELRDTKIKINSICPGFVNSGNPGTENMPRSVQQGAKIILEMAMIAEDGPSGEWFDDNGKIPW